VFIVLVRCARRASLGFFLWYNAHPSGDFHGRCGVALAGGTLGVIAVIIKQEILLFFRWRRFVLEAVS